MERQLPCLDCALGLLERGNIGAVEGWYCGMRSSKQNRPGCIRVFVPPFKGLSGVSLWTVDIVSMEREWEGSRDPLLRFQLPNPSHSMQFSIIALGLVVSGSAHGLGKIN